MAYYLHAKIQAKLVALACMFAKQFMIETSLPTYHQIKWTIRQRIITQSTKNIILHIVAQL